VFVYTASGIFSPKEVVMLAYSSTGKLWLHVILSVFLIPLCVACLADGARNSASLVADLDAELPVVVANGNSPSTQVAVVQRDQIIWSQAFGQNTSPHHVYMNASVQKMFTAVAVLQLVERGFVELDADVQEYLPFAVQHPRVSEDAHHSADAAGAALRAGGFPASVRVGYWVCFLTAIPAMSW
jgi:CubicO group peptidase (beta-lactamase class C family)